MQTRKLLFVTLSLVLVCQLGWSQQHASYVQQKALQAQATGKGMPVIPASAVRAGQHRPFVWIGGPLGVAQRQLRSQAQRLCPASATPATPMGCCFARMLCRLPTRPTASLMPMGEPAWSSALSTLSIISMRKRT